MRNNNTKGWGYDSRKEKLPKSIYWGINLLAIQWAEGEENLPTGWPRFGKNIEFGLVVMGSKVAARDPVALGRNKCGRKRA